MGGGSCLIDLDGADLQLNRQRSKRGQSLETKLKNAEAENRFYRLKNWSHLGTLSSFYQLLAVLPKYCFVFQRN